MFSLNSAAMEKEDIQRIIENYIKAYNSFDVDVMLANMDDQVIFKNLTNGETTLTTAGINDFRRQAVQAKALFKEREQKITHMTIDHDQAEVIIDYKAVLASDLPNGSKAGDKLSFKGKSLFEFRNGKIITLTDIS